MEHNQSNISAFQYPQYPFSESKFSNKERLSITDIPTYIISPGMIEDCFPHVKSQLAVYISGVTIDKWNDTYECIYVYCCEFKIPNIFIIWNNDEYVRYQINDTNWKSLLPLPDKILDVLIGEYGIGFHIPLIESSVRNSLLAYPCMGPFQLYVSPGNDEQRSSLSKYIPKFNYDNIPAFDVIKERNLKVFCHAALNINMSRYDVIKYISELLVYCTGHGIKGAVFHVGTNRDIPYKEARDMMLNNIVNGIRKAKFLPTQKGTAKFILETPAGKGNELLSNINDFINFCNEILSYPDIRDHFAICVDTCHVHQSGYSPYHYLIEVLKILPVELVHFNDSHNNWYCRKDHHAKPGTGYIPWIYLMKVAQLCKLMNIPAVLEN